MLWLLITSIIFASMNSIVLHIAKLDRKAAIYKFNFLCSLVWCICLYCANGFKLRLTENVILFGIIYGIAQVLFILFKTSAMNSGPVSITTLIGNSSLVISVVVCLVLWNEPIYVADIIGLIFLGLGIVLCTYKKSELKFTFRWKIYTFLFLVLASSVGIVFKAFSKKESSDYSGDMMLVSAIVMIVTYFLITLFLGGFTSKEKNDKKEIMIFVTYAIISGLFSCVYNRANIYLSGALDGVIFFPSFNGGVVLVSTMLSIFMLKEKLLLKQWLGILSGIVGICIIGVL